MHVHFFWTENRKGKGIKQTGLHILCKRGEHMIDKDEFLKIFPMGIRKMLYGMKEGFCEIQEIRLRVNCPLAVRKQGEEYFVSEQGGLIRDKRNACLVSKSDLTETMEYLSSYSMYAFEEELRQGFLTIQGGHRVGIAGKIVMNGEQIRNISCISFLNIRISHEIRGCADRVLPFLVKEKNICHTLIISPPCCGKTTLLRDLVRQISNGNSFFRGKNVGVVDERSEIGGSYLGVPQNDLGIRTDLLDCCPKALGMMMLIRSMSPDIIAVDEIGDSADVRAIEAVLNCGCKLIATVHGSSVEDIRRKPLLDRLVKERVFERYVILENRKELGGICGIFDEKGTDLYRGEAVIC